jgi:tRNA(Ile)-lysidine synthetase-like protein
MDSQMRDLYDLFQFWFANTDNWFNLNPEFDELIKSRFSNLVEKYDIDKLNKYDFEKIKDNYIYSISLIILHDQILRHLYRNDKDIITNYLNKILNFSEQTYARFKYDLKSEHYSFVLLPLRHTNEFNKITYVIEETKIKIKNHPYEQTYKRFLKATLERYIKLNLDKENIKEYLPEKCNVIYDISQICELGLNKYIPTTFVELNLIPEYFQNLIDNIKKYTKVKKGVVSLSGGVDSMILSYVLKYINIDIIAVHINYNNRPECESECILLQKWCSFLNIKLYIRKIREINRQEMMDFKMRDLYESYTRDIRYNTYINANRDYFDNGCVFLGHNNDDEFENIFTNIVSESHYDDLRGMCFESFIKFKNIDINFCRPMLNIKKQDIYKSANYLSIPHFKDSTPKWSQRGKIRDLIRPNIEQWDSRAIESFFKLSDKVSDLMKIADFSANNIAENIKLNMILEINLDKIYSKTLFKLIFDKLQIDLSQKSLSAFYDKLIFIKQNKLKYKLNSVEKFNINKTTQIKWKNLENNNIILFF